MRKILLMVFLMLSACNNSTESGQHQGGSSDGGGNAVGSEPHIVTQALEKVRGDLRNLVHRVRYWEAAGHGTMYRSEDMEWFFTHPDLDRVIDTMEIVTPEGPCQSSHPEHEDGSANLQKNSICLSKGRLARLGPDELRLQILALGVHEVTHLLGRHESSAEILQTSMFNLKSLSSVADEKIVVGELQQLFHAYDLLQTVIILFEVDLKGNRMYFCSALREFGAVIADSHTRMNGVATLYPPDIDLTYLQSRIGTSFFYLCNNGEPTVEDLDYFATAFPEIKSHLKDIAQRMVDYDSIEKRYQYILEQMK